MTEFERLFAEAVLAEAPGQHDHVLSDDEAGEVAAAAWGRIVENGLAFAARRLVAESRQQQQQRERQAARAERQGRERRDSLTRARKALRTLFGRELGGKLDPEKAYDPIFIEGRLYLVDAGQVEATIRATGSAGLHAEMDHGEELAIAGYRLGRHFEKGSLAGLNPDAEEFARLLGAKSEARAKAEARAAADREQEARQSRRERELATFGVALDD